MKRLLALVLLTAALAIGKETPTVAGDQATEARTPEEMYAGLRNLALNMKPEDLELRPGKSEPYGIVMDIDVDGATATITSFATGDASLYFSHGGGIIGAGQSSPAAHKAAKAFVNAAASHLSEMTIASAQPRPGRGQVTFYVLTDSGVYSITRSENELGEGKNSLSPLFYAGQEVLTEIRLTQASQGTAN